MIALLEQASPIGWVSWLGTHARRDSMWVYALIERKKTTYKRLLIAHKSL